MKTRSRVFLFLFFISGACGLIYEVVWTRLFIVVIGNTVFSVSAILTVFMAGLALGSRIAGRTIDRRPIPLIRTYALLEGGVGVYHLILPLLLKAADPLFGALYASAGNSFLIMTAGRLVIVFLILIVPATLMGATLPILIRFYVQNIARVGTEAGHVYTANTLGAAAGTIVAGFLLVPHLGVTAALAVAVGLNLFICAVAWTLARTADAHAAAAVPESAPPGPGIILLAIAMSGFAALLDEVAWTRVLGLVVGPTTYAFTLMLASMITGLGLGAAIGARLTARRAISPAALAWAEVAVGVTSLAVVPAFGQLPLWIGRLVTKYVESFASIQGIEFLIFFGLMLLPTLFLGMTFPIASRLYARSDSELGGEISAVYSFNTIGGIAGALIAGFALIPHAGSEWTLIAAGWTNVLAAVLLAPPPRRWLPGVAAVVAVAGALFLPRWDPELMSSGAYKYAPYYGPRLDLASTLKGGDLLYYKEGATTTVSARRLHGETTLAVDGKVDATDSGDMTTQLMLAHVPLLLSDKPKNVAIIGLGSGVTAGAALRYPIESLDVVEISPEVVAASDFFKHVNHDVLRDPRTHLIIGDGRNHLRYVRKQYDVIVSEPSNPWMSGMASLFTREFFQEALERLTPHGIHCQWFHSYNMSTDDLRTIVATFRSVFPHAQLWTLNENDFLLLGSLSAIEIAGPVVTRNFQTVSGDLKRIGIVDLYSVMTLYKLEDQDLDTFSKGAMLNTDSLPRLEFSAPRYIYANTSDENLAALNAVQRAVARPAFIAQVADSAGAENHRNKGRMYLTSESYNDAIRELELAITDDVHDEQAWNGLLQAARSLHERPELKKFFEKMLADHQEAIVVKSSAEFYSQENDYAKAASLLQQVLNQNPGDIAALEKLCEVYADQGNEKLQETVDRLLRLDPANAKGLFHLATLRVYQQRFDEAIQLVKSSLAKEPSNPRARNLLAIAYGQTFQHDLAEAEFRRTIEDFPKDALTRNNYGLYLMDRGKFPEAIEQFQIAIEMNPEDPQPYVGMGEAYRQGGHSDQANHWYRIALQLDPNQPVARQYAR